MRKDLTKGSISKNLIELALPIMGTSFLQMAYNLTDVYWVGHLGDGSVAAVGTAGYYLWLSFAFVLLVKIGTEVRVANFLGAKNYEKTNKYAYNGVIVALFIGFIYFLMLAVFRSQLIDFFDIKEKVVTDMSKDYLLIVSFVMPFSFFIQIISAIYNASGHSKLPFRTNGIGLIINMILDPLFILVFDLGVVGAAIATAISQVLVATALLFELKWTPPYKGYSFRNTFDMEVVYDILKLSIAPALQSGLFTIISMFIGRFVASFSTTAIAVQRIGTQIEAITYMTASGFGVALSGMVGQNFGAKIYKRVHASIKSGFLIMGIFGIFSSLLLIVFARELFSIFISSEPTVSMGATYLRILGISQVFMCVEITLGGAFNGVGKSQYPALVSIGLNALRIPIAYLLAFETPLGLNGIWWTISFTTVGKGLLIVLLTATYLYRFIESKHQKNLELI